MDTRESIRQHIQGLLELKGEYRELSDDEPLLISGLLDSMDVLQTVLFLEENHGVDFSVKPFNPEDFDCIDSIERLVMSQSG